MKKYYVTHFLISLLIFAVWFTPLCFAVDYVEATSVLNQAEFDLESAFDAVSVASNVGTDVTSLIEKLETGVSLLSEAQLAFRFGDYNEASLLALECSTILESLIIDADRLKVDAEKTRNYELFLTVIGSTIGLIFLVILAILFWKIIDKRYTAKVMDKET